MKHIDEKNLYESIIQTRTPLQNSYSQLHKYTWGLKIDFIHITWNQTNIKQQFTKYEINILIHLQYGSIIHST